MALSDRERGRIARRTVIDIARRRQRPGTGSNLEILETPLRTWPDLRDVLSGIPWAVAGAVATRRYTPERGTQDLDIVIRESDAKQVSDQMRAAGYEHTGNLSIGGTTWRAPDGTPVGVIEGGEPWWPRALEEASTSFDQQGLPVLTLPFLVLMKLVVGRPIDSSDVSRIMARASSEERAAAEALVRRYEPESLDDLASLLALGRLELETPGPPQREQP